MKLKVFLLVAICVTLVAFYFIYNKTLLNDRVSERFIYVSPDGNDQNEGTKLKPFRTLQQASKEATAGTTVLVREGIYHEILNVKYSGTSPKPIIFKNYKNEKVVISGKSFDEPKEETALINIIDKDYISIQGFTVEDLSTSVADATVMGVYVTGTSSHIKLKQNHVRRIETQADNGNAHGIAIYGTGEMQDIQILDNTIEKLRLGSSESLVLNGNIDGFMIANNIVRQNNNIGIDLIGYEGTADQNDYVRNGTVENNIVYDNSSYGNPAYGEDYSAGGIYLDGGSDISIQENKVYHNDIGIEATSEHKGKYAKNISITNNKVYDNSYTGISIGGYDNKRGGTKDSVISNNIIYGNDMKRLGGGQLLIQYDVKENKIEQNIITASDSRIFLANEFTINKGNIFTKNIYHKEEGKKGIWIWEGKEFKSFSVYQKSTGNDLESKYINPQ